MSYSSQTQTLAGLRMVAAFEFLKGVLALTIGFALASLARHGKDPGDIAQGVVYVFHINPERHLLHVLLRWAARLNSMNLMLVALVAVLYSVMRFVEAYGLWHARVWAQWFALVAGAVYVPLEIYELMHKATFLKWMLLLVNVAIVLYMIYLRTVLRPAKQAASS